MNRFHRWYCRSGHWRRAMHDQILPWALGDVELGDRVLEVGPGPGVTTDALRHLVPSLTTLELDETLAARLGERLEGSNVTVEQGDATAMAFPDASFTGVVCLTMLHHVPSPVLQDQLLREVRRVLIPGGAFVGSDSRTSVLFRLAHLADTMMLVEPGPFAERLRTAGFVDVSVDEARRAFRFRARAPLTPEATIR